MRRCITGNAGAQVLASHLDKCHPRGTPPLQGECRRFEPVSTTVFLRPGVQFKSVERDSSLADGDHAHAGTHQLVEDILVDAQVGRRDAGEEVAVEMPVAWAKASPISPKKTMVAKCELARMRMLQPCDLRRRRAADCHRTALN
jgi:hypothetical protein